MKQAALVACECMAILHMTSTCPDGNRRFSWSYCSVMLNVVTCLLVTKWVSILLISNGTDFNKFVMQVSLEGSVSFKHGFQSRCSMSVPLSVSVGVFRHITHPDDLVECLGRCFSSFIPWTKSENNFYILWNTYLRKVLRADKDDSREHFCRHRRGGRVR